MDHNMLAESVVTVVLSAVAALFSIGRFIGHSQDFDKSEVESNTVAILQLFSRSWSLT
jgi:hypothetical protein